MRFELTTPTLARLCSTTELRPLLDVITRSAMADSETRYMAQTESQIKRKNALSCRVFTAVLGEGNLRGLPVRFDHKEISCL